MQPKLYPKDRDKIYRVTSLVNQGAHSYVELCFSRQGRYPRVEVKTFGPTSTTGTIETFEIPSWQKAHEKFEEELQKYVFLGGEVVKDEKHSFYMASPDTRISKFIAHLGRLGCIATYIILEINAGVHRNNESTRKLDKRSRYTWKNFGFMESSLIVSQDSVESGELLPSEGYFTLATELSGEVFPTLESKRAFWESQLSKIFRYYESGLH